MKHIRKDRADLQKANSVLVIGAGLVGFEIATEVKATYPEKKVTLVDANGVIMKRMAPSVQARFLQEAQQMGVVVVLNERIVDFRPAERRYISASGQQFWADKVFVATGPRPCSGFLRNGCLADAVDESGGLKINAFMQVEGFRNIFSGGDVASCGSEKTAATARRCGAIIARNIVRLEKGKSLLAGGQKGLPTIDAGIFLISIGDQKAACLLFKRYCSIRALHLASKYNIGESFIHCVQHNLPAPAWHMMGKLPTPPKAKRIGSARKEDESPSSATSSYSSMTTVGVPSHGQGAPELAPAVAAMRDRGLARTQSKRSVFDVKFRSHGSLPADHDDE